MSKLNILFAIADDASHFGIYGYDFVKTPHIDRLAKEGTKFNNCFTTNPKCAPSRASILTGKHTWQLEEGCDHYGYFPADQILYTDILKKRGYHVGFTGKGWGPGDYKTLANRDENPAGREFNIHRLSPPGVSFISPCDYTENFKTFLENKQDDQPFCFWYGCHEPHRPYKEGEAGGSWRESNEIVVPPYWPDEERIRQDMADYSYEISWFDEQLGKMIALLKKRGLYDNTVIVVTSDNGAPFPRVKGQMYEDDFKLPMIILHPQKNRVKEVDKLVSFTDFFPTFLEIAEQGKTQSSVGSSLIPLLETEDSPQHRESVLMGRERHDLGREGDKGYPVRCLRTKDFLLIWNIKANRWPAGNPETGFTNCDSSPTKDRILELKQEGEEYYFNLAFARRPEWELYHIVSDPHCMINLTGEEKYATLLQDLKVILKAKLKFHGDPRSVGKGDEFDSYSYVGSDHHSWKALQEGRWNKQDF